MVDDSFINGTDLIVGNTYFSHKKMKHYKFTKKGRTRDGVCIFYLLKEGKKVPLPYYKEGVTWLELTTATISE